MRFVRSAEVVKMLGVSRTTLWRMVQAGAFPRPIHITERNRGYPLDDVLAWMEARLVFHYALKVFPDLDGSAAGFEPIRRFIGEGEGNGFVTELRDQVVENFRRGERPTQWSHILMAQRHHRRVIGCAQFFVSPESMPFPFRVDIGPNPGRLDLGRQRRAHMFLVDAVDSGGRPRGRVVDFPPAELHLGLP